MINNQQRELAESPKISCCCCIPLKFAAILFILMFMGTLVNSVQYTVYTSSLLTTLKESEQMEYNLANVIPEEMIKAAKTMRYETEKAMKEQGVKTPTHEKTVEEELVLGKDGLGVLENILMMVIITLII